MVKSFTVSENTAGGGSFFPLVGFPGYYNTISKALVLVLWAFHTRNSHSVEMCKSAFTGYSSYYT